MDELVPQKNGEPATIGGRPAPHLEAGGNTLEGLNAANARPDPTLQQNPDIAADLISDLHKDQKTPNLRTFASDAADAVREHNLSSVSLAAQKIQQRRDISPQAEMDSSQGSGGFFKKTIFILGALLLIALSIAGVTYAVIVAKPKQAPVAQLTAAQNALLDVDDVKTVSVPPHQSTLTAWTQEAQALGTENAALVQINFVAAGTTSPMDSQTFLADLGAKNIPDWFIRAIGPAYVAGFYHDGSRWDPVLILSVASYDNAFAGMLQWESGMASDLAPLYAAQLAATSSVAVSSSTPLTLSSLPAFSDVFIDNKNTRIFAVPGQQPLLLYSFPTQSTLIITTSEAAITEIFNRFDTDQFVH